MKSLVYLPLLIALCICVAQANGVTYKAYKLRTDFGNFIVLSASNTTKCDDLRLVFNTNGDVKKAAKTQGSTVLQPSEVENALVTSLSLKDFQLRTTLNIQNVAESTTNCAKSRRHRLHSKKNQAQLLDTDSVYITTFVNKHTELKDKLYNSDDEGNSQYFDTAASVKEYWWHAKDKGTGKPSADSVAKDLGLKSGKAAIKTVKLYYRLSGAISKSVILEGNKRFHGDNLYKQVPTVTEAAYWFVWKPSGVKDPADIHHEFLEVCLEDGSRLIVDRGSRETALQDTFNTRVRFIYLDSNGGDCSLESNNWVDKELADKKFTDKNFNVREGKKVSGYNLAGLIDHAANYVEKFPKYNTLTNCQHFATNTFNLLTDSTLDYDSIDLMENHSEHSGKEPKLPFGLKIEKANKRRRFNKKSSHKRIHRRRI